MYNHRRRFVLSSTTTMTAAACVSLLVISQGTSVAQDILAPPPPGADAQPEVLLRGPLHEAFAEVVNLDPQAGIIVPRTAPDPIAEMPPEVKPAENAVWIPGYWAWDDDRNDFIWVSGVWRAPPPGRRWVPGYWTPEGRGSRWIAGFWAKAEADAVDLLPAPPKALEQGPNGPAPGNDFFWVSGCWIYNGTGFVWRPGLWTRGYTQWIWVPSHYVWTPRGCIYVPGYWDYRIADRGMCFAPVYFRNPTRWRVDRVWWPQVAIDLPWLHLHLFVRPQYCHYYFGDWYVGYDRLGIYSGYSYYVHRGYDPVWTYFEWVSRGQGIDYARRVHGWEVYYQQHADMRPPRNLADQHRFVVQNATSPYLKQTVLAVDVRDVLARHDDRIQRLSEPQRRDIRQHSLVGLDIVDARRKVEIRDDRDLRDPSPRPGQTTRGRVLLPLTPEAQEARRRAVASRVDRPEPAPSREAPRPREMAPPRETAGATPAETNRPRVRGTFAPTPTETADTRVRPGVETPSTRPQPLEGAADAATRRAGPIADADAWRRAVPSGETSEPRDAGPPRETAGTRARTEFARTPAGSQDIRARSIADEPTVITQRPESAADSAARRIAEITADAAARREAVRAQAEAMSRQRATQSLARQPEVRDTRPAEADATRPFTTRVERPQSAQPATSIGTPRGLEPVGRPGRSAAPEGRDSAPRVDLTPAPRTTAPSAGSTGRGVERSVAPPATVRPRAGAETPRTSGSFATSPNVSTARPAASPTRAPSPALGVARPATAFRAAEPSPQRQPAASVTEPARRAASSPARAAGNAARPARTAAPQPAQRESADRPRARFQG